jgi:tetratricopeptide (TPR) repeat protein
VRPLAFSLATVAAVCVPSPTLGAADKWIEIKSPHVTVMSSANAGDTRTLAWQMEQIRTALMSILPWARVDLDRPLLVLAVDNEHKMRALAPEYWERDGGLRPASVWVSGADRHYLAIRSDLRVEASQTVNPHVSAYFSYISLILQQSLAPDVPLWFSRGLAGVLSNTIVRDSYLLVGPPIPWHLEHLRERGRLRLPALVAVTRESREFTSGEGLSRFDAQAWAFVHFLMFADNGARRPKINQFFTLVTGGTPPDVAMAESIGKVEELELDFVTYVNRSLFMFGKMSADASVKREGFAQRAMAPDEAASSLALFHTAMRRPAEARAAIAEARTTSTTAPDSYVAEGLLLDRDGKPEEARAALARAVAGGSTNAYAYYRLAGLRWGPNPDRETLVEIEKLLARSAELNPRHAWTYASFGEVRSLLGTGEALGLVSRAIKLDPSEPSHRLTAARILLRAGQHGEALKAVQAALALASTDEDRSRARELQQAIERDTRR